MKIKVIESWIRKRWWRRPLTTESFAAAVAELKEVAVEVGTLFRKRLLKRGYSEEVVERILQVIWGPIMERVLALWEKYRLEDDPNVLIEFTRIQDYE